MGIRDVYKAYINVYDIPLVRVLGVWLGLKMFGIVSKAICTVL